ncbi:RNA-directed DNA polymerase from transposon x-element [Colletotrichum musicola]|uniref:RNA-directed DNA polymerase from transposon x-element n=1 Tax=Colletotrichum musicola TaxID=2175873 RepID=A0A8H6J3Z4_9PEZI|nr:RNA-directed DNA polymerase from transposon x-element [Colletotrichum musicola]
MKRELQCIRKAGAAASAASQAASLGQYRNPAPGPYPRVGDDETTTTLLDYRPPPVSIIGGDFNIRNEIWEPGGGNTGFGPVIGHWAHSHGLAYIGEPGVPTHLYGYVLDLIFLDIPMASAQILPNLYPGANHKAILITVAPPPTLPEPSPRGYRVPNDLLGRFADMVRIRPLVPVVADVGLEAIEQAAILLTETLGTALRAVGKATEPAGRGRAKAAGWWSPDCKETRDRMLEAWCARSRV